MDARSILSTFAPNVASLGYALFLAVNAAGVWGGVFPFLPAGFQTHDVMLGFFLAQSIVLSLAYLASAVGVYCFPGPTRTFLVGLAAAPYALGWACLIAAMYLHGWELPLAVCGGAFLGLGSAGFYMLWQRLFASESPEKGNRDLLAGTAYAAVLYFALYLIPQAVTALLIPLVFLPLFALSVILQSRTISRDQPMFQDVPREHPHVYRHLVQTYWRSALGVGVIGFCAGIMRALAMANAGEGGVVNAISMAIMLAAALLLGFAWYFRSIRLNATAIYRIVFPFAITLIAMLPLLKGAYIRWLAAGLFAVYTVSVVLMMFQCAQISRDRGVNPVFVYGFFGAIVYSLNSIGFIAGTFAESAQVIGMSPLGLVALVAVYLLSMMSFIGAGGFASAIDAANGDIEFMALRNEPAALPLSAGDGIVSGAEAKADRVGAVGRDAVARQAFSTPSSSPAQASPEEGDLIAVQAQVLREHFKLSARETEIMELIARGNTVARIAEMLVVSENTVRTHSKRIYTKLDIHRKQELIDLIKSYRP